MKGQMLLLGLLCMIVTYTASSIIVFLIISIGIWFHWKRCHKGHLLFVCLLILFSIRVILPVEHTKPQSKLLVILEIKTNYVIASNGDEKVIVYGLENANFKDVYQIRGTYEKVSTIHNAGTFSFQEWLKKRNIHYSIEVKYVQKLQDGTGLRHTIYEHIQTMKNKELRNLLKTVLFGIHEEDVSYLLLSSGMHISFLFHIIERLLRKKVKRETASIIVFFSILFLSYGTILSSSLLRILCFRLVRICFYRWNVKDQVGSAILLLLLLEPNILWELSFLLPVLFQLAFLFNITKRRTILLSYSVLFPIQLCFFHACNPIQIVLFRFVRIVYASIYLCSLLFLIGLPESISTWCLFLIDMVKKVEAIGFTIYAKPPLLWLLLWCWWICHLLSTKKRKEIVKTATLIFFLFLIPYLDPFARIIVVDVGQGDCTIIQLPFRRGVYVIDVMGHLKKNIPKDNIVPVLHANGITTIDKVILTHQDYDHSGGIEQLKKEITVKEVIQTKAQAHNQKESWLQFLLLKYQGEDENDNSIITMMKLYHTTFINMGDLGIAGEKQLLNTYPNLQADILKVGHHGSTTSSSLPFLHTLHPNVALISSGRDNRYGHPHKDVMKHLQQEHISTFVTARQGGVTICILPFITIVETADKQISWFY